jgi:hypothetical protein
MSSETINENNSSNTRNNQRVRHLSRDQRLLLNIYTGFYNQYGRQIDELYNAQDEIIHSINEIVGIRNQNTGNTINQNTHNTTTPDVSNRYYEFTYATTPNSIPRNNSNNRRNNQLFNSNSILNTILNNGSNSLSDLFSDFYSNIPVYPSEEELRNATVETPFSQIIVPTNSSCPITLERFEENTIVTQILHCGHIFNSNSINLWFSSNTRCPVCRYDIREYRNRNTFNNINLQNNISRNLDSSEAETKEDIQENHRDENQNRENIDEINNSEIPINNYEIPRNNTSPLSNLTGLLINNLISSFGNSRINQSYINDSRYYYDSSQNQIVFEGYLNNNL